MGKKVLKIYPEEITDQKQFVEFGLAFFQLPIRNTGIGNSGCDCNVMSRASFFLDKLLKPCGESVHIQSLITTS